MLSVPSLPPVHAHPRPRARSPPEFLAHTSFLNRFNLEASHSHAATSRNRPGTRPKPGLGARENGQVRVSLTRQHAPSDFHPRLFDVHLASVTRDPLLPSGSWHDDARRGESTTEHTFTRRHAESTKAKPFSYRALQGSLPRPFHAALLSSGCPTPAHTEEARGTAEKQ